MLQAANDNFKWVKIVINRWYCADLKRDVVIIGYVRENLI